MTKEVRVTGHVPMSVRKQVKGRRNKTIKNKRIKKIPTPRAPTPAPTPASASASTPAQEIHHTGGKRSILKKRVRKNKTMKQVRFNLDSQGVQVGKFRNAHRVKMNTSKHKGKRSKNRTSKLKKFKIRFTPGDTSTSDDDNTLVSHTGGGLNLTEMLPKLTDGVDISRV